ncbi:MAG: GUN4 domain-containing protein [Stigonema ocellatum SAG 48.90 = DSM 106950]|nr:GUN4 domain-containing protein [Stigonema ocellatum SAG 48.90 = DSM 106950]
MIYCLNPNCPKPENPDETNFCLHCGTGLVRLLRGRYRIIEPLGGGEFGHTYLAEDLDKLNERCIVKQLTPGVQDSEALQKATELFEQEARRLQQLGLHPQIPTLYASFKENNHFYLVQEFVEGENLLQELVQQGTFNEVKIRELLNDLLPILHFVHSQQVIHQDIKPENLIRRQRDRKLVLIEFGATKQVATAIGTSGRIIGSFGYGPVEQMQEGNAYPSTDLYSLGATCFHLLTQMNPKSLWEAQGYGWVQGWQQHLKYPISHELEQVLSKLLQIDHTQRYQSASEVVPDLDLNQKQQPTTTVPPNFSVKQPPRLQLPQWKIGAGLTVIAIGIAINLTRMIPNTSPPPSPSPKPSQSTPTEPPKDSQPTPTESPIPTYLQNLDSTLKDRKWKEASTETFAVMLKLAGRTNQGWLDSTSLNNFSCSNLKEIDQLWVKHSDGIFGFSVQKRIYLATGNRLGTVGETDSQEWDNFANSVGWKDGNFDSNLITTKGHFPFFRRGNTNQIVKNINQILFTHCDRIITNS